MTSKRIKEALSEKADQTNDRERALRRLQQLREQFQRLTDSMKKRIDQQQQQQASAGAR